MKKLIALIIFGIILIFLFFSCPNKQDHKTKLSGEITAIIHQKLTDAGIEDALTNSPEFQVIIEELATNSVDVDNYLLFSIGKLSINGNEQVVSFGIAGHVFTFNDKIVRQAAELYDKYIDR